MMHFFEQIGIAVTQWVRVFRDFTRLCFETIYWVFMGPFKKKRIPVSNSPALTRHGLPVTKPGRNGEQNAQIPLYATQPVHR